MCVVVIPMFLVFLNFVFSCENVTISNTKNLYDTNHKRMITGELDTLFHDDVYYFVMTDWGGCSDYGCKSPCVYSGNHSVVLYSTTDFVSFENHGVILNSTQRTPSNGQMFRPHLIYNQKTKLFVLWYENRFPEIKGDRNYAVATSTNVVGPYKTIIERVVLMGCSPGGDFSLFVDPKDQSAYIILTHYSYFCLEKLDESYTQGTGISQQIKAPESSEAPVMFKRNELYYVLFGKGCCACTEGSNIYVFVSSDGPLGKYKFEGDVGTDKDGSYTTKSQQATVFKTNCDEFVWVGNNWGSDEKHEFNHDLLYFYPLVWDDSGSIEHVEWKNYVNFEL